VPRIAIRRSTAALVLSTTAATVGVGFGADGGLAGATPSASAGTPTMRQASRPGLAARVLVVDDAIARLRRSGHSSWWRRFGTGRSSAAPRTIGRQLAARRGWTGEEWNCLDELWTRESHWRVHISNDSSGAYGIPQALPPDKMATAGSRWRDSATTQIVWGLSYIAAKYGAPCDAWRHSQGYGYY
jgi:hypothetical protein